MVSFIFKKWAMVSFIWPFPIFLQKFEKSGQKWPEKMAKSPLFLKSGHPLKPSDCNGFRGLVAKNPLFSLINVKKK
jgi:hypothetical protein